MAQFELDNQMLKKLDKLHSACLTLNTMKIEIEASYQINHHQIIICLHKSGNWDWPLYTFQRFFVNLTYANLDQALEEINGWMKYKFVS